MMPKRKTEELLTPTASDRGTQGRLTKTGDEEKIIINRQGRSTYSEENSVLRSGATPLRRAVLGAVTFEGRFFRFMAQSTMPYLRYRSCTHIDNQ